MKNLCFYTCILLTLACSNTPESGGKTNGIGNVEEIPTPCKEGGEGNLFLDKEQGKLYLSWIEYENDTTDVLKFSHLEKGAWVEPKEIARGNNWFVNWADFPALVVYDKGQKMAAHWLAKTSGNTYDYNVNIAQSSDGGKSWATPFILHQDGVDAEHGFVSMFPLGNNRIFTVWLDGRNTKSEDGHGNEHAHGEAHGHGGAMTLRTADFDENGITYNDTELDDKVCDCCQTGAIMGADGPLVVYRDRLPGEIRDIAIVRKTGDAWTKPALVHEDNWEMKACPVNGPAIDADEKQVVVAWYTMAAGEAKVLVASSSDNGASFGKPIRIDNGEPIGRVDVVMVKEYSYVSWIENDAVQLAKVESGKVVEKFVVAKTSASRKSGFPVMKYMKNHLYFVWTTIEGDRTCLKTVVIAL